MTSTPSNAGTMTATTRATQSATAGSDPTNELRAFLDELLDTQCRLVGGVAGAIYLLGAGGRGGVMARYQLPGARALNLEAAGTKLEKIVESACRSAGTPVAPAEGGPGQERAPGVIDAIRLAGGSALYGDEPTYPVLACPLVADGRVEGCSVVVLPEARAGRAPADADDLLLRISLAAARFEAYLWRQHAMNQTQQKALLLQTLELLDASQQGASAQAMSSLLCHELARRFACARVSIGLIGRGDRLRLVGVSGTEQADRKAPAAESLESAMEECALQDTEVVYPPTDGADPAERRIVRAHDALSKKFGPSAIVSLPLRVEGDLVGVVVLERDAADPFPPGAVPLLRLVAEFIGPALWTRRLADRGIWGVTRDRARRLGAAIVGPRHTGSKLACLALLASLAAASLVPIPGRIVAEATIEAEERRTISPPFAGYLGEVLVRPGDPVDAGTVLARMDTRAMTLERDELLARREGAATQRDDAMARREFEKVRASSAQIAEIDASLRLLETHLARAEVRSPFEGWVAMGDQRDQIGSRVEPSQPLFELIAEERLIVLNVDERDITRVRLGQSGWIAPRARPDQRASIEVVRISPVAQAAKGANVYRVEARVVGEPADWLRPGATAVGRLEDGSTTAMALLFRPIVDELRLRWWW